jgi:hypothetical protein
VNALSGNRLAVRLAAALSVAALVGISVTAQAQSARVEPEASRLLKASTDFVAAQQQFSVDTRVSLEAVLFSGQKVEFNHTGRQSIQRPNKLRSERTGDLVEQLFIYDGQSVTLYNPGDKTYAAVAAPASLEDMLDFARTTLNIVAPAGDLVYRNAYQILLEDVVSGFVVGKGIIEGAVCYHLAFRGTATDWQIWVQEGPQPLPRKLVITSRDVFNSPQFAVTITKWDLQPQFNDQTFAFAPPRDAKKIDFLPQPRPASGVGDAVR